MQMHRMPVALRGSVDPRQPTKPQETEAMFDTLSRRTAHHDAIQQPEGMSAAQTFAERCPHQPGIRKVAASETLWCEGEERSHIFIVRSGAICLSRMLPDGRRIVLGFAYPGDIIGIGSDFHYCDAQTVQATRLESIPASSFKRAVVEDPGLGKQATAAVNQALDAAYHHVVVISKLSANERLASFLMALSDRNEKHGLSPLSVVLPMRRIDIADYLGLTIETVSRTFTIFRNTGLIAMDQASIVKFRDIRKLRALAAGEGE
jgi:CRP/FNR family transcriptional regulator, anaerobic regulatory protein